MKYWGVFFLIKLIIKCYNYLLGACFLSTTNKDFKVKNGLQVSQGAVFGSPITVGDPTLDSHAATKKYVDDHSGSGGAIFTASTTAPSNPSTGDAWFNTNNGATYIYYDSFWIESISKTGPQGVQGDTGPAASAPLALTQSGNSASYPLTISSSNEQSGGTGYSDLLKLVNSKSGATNINKFLRINSTGGLELINSGYTAQILSISDAGKIVVTKNSSATSGSPNNNAITFDNHGHIFDDGNLHIHSNSGSIWLNSLDGSTIQINKQINSGSGGMIVGGNITADNISDSGWTQISSFSNSFSAPSGKEVYYRKLNGVVWIRGAVLGGTAGTTAFTLPSGYRPATTWVVAVQNYGSTGDTYLTVNTDGTVQPSASGSWFNTSFPLG